jgi:dTDP-4-dehydrorhamnose 3,5-epimerase
LIKTSFGPTDELHFDKEQLIPIFGRGWARARGSWKAFRHTPAMTFTETKLKGAFLIELKRNEDIRGFFARSFCAREFAACGLKPVVAQCNVSFSHNKGTLRGMHYQSPPATEVKLVRCTRGALWDVIIDLRPASPTYLSHISVELSAQNRLAVYVPELFAHGFQTMSNETEVFYQMSEFYAPGCARGLRYNDPALGVEWPLPVSVISAQDASWPLITEAEI